MRIAYVTMLFPAGAETFACSDVRALIAQGLEVEVHSLRPAQSDTEQLAVERGVAPLHRSYNGAGSLVRGFGAALRHPLAAFRLFRQVARCRGGLLGRSLILAPRALDIASRLHRSPVDRVHLFWGHYPSLVAVALRGMGSRKPVTVFLGAYDLEAEYPPSQVAVAESLALFTHAEVNRERLEQMAPRSRVHVVHRGIPVDEPGPEVTREPVIAAVGRFIKSKNMHEALEVFAALGESAAGARLLMIGDGPERAALEQLARDRGIADRVTFTGFLPRAEVQKHLLRAGVMLLMSTKPGERLPNVIKEGLFAGLFCVATRTPGIDELIGPDCAGAVVEPHGIEQAAEAIRGFLAAGEEQRQEMARRNRAWIVERFDVNRQMQRYVEVWRGLNRDSG
ncbi:hypothetical protein ABI59_06155 [Acidobacteria bacterium Mor1]|nr:hypothetical protein ABI59_06155 [Acidobacteria bacterium Mor1]